MSSLFKLGKNKAVKYIICMFYDFVILNSYANSVRHYIFPHLSFSRSLT